MTRPPCMDAATFAAWRDAAEQVRPGKPIPSPCRDCTREYAAEMLAVGRCEPVTVPKSRVSDATHEDILALHDAGLNNSAIARKLGVNRTTVLAHLVNADMVTKGERLARSEARRSEVLRLRGAGLSFAQAARIVGISETWARACARQAA